MAVAPTRTVKSAFRPPFQLQSVRPDPVDVFLPDVDQRNLFADSGQVASIDTSHDSRADDRDLHSVLLARQSLHSFGNDTRMVNPARG